MRADFFVDVTAAGQPPLQIALAICSMVKVLFEVFAFFQNGISFPEAIEGFAVL